MEKRQPQDAELRMALDRVVENELVFARGSVNGFELIVRSSMNFVTVVVLLRCG